MIVAAVRQCADWLTDATNGVNVQLASVPGDSSDVPPPLVTVWDATRFEWVSRGVVPRDRTGALPILLVRGPNAAELKAWAGASDGGWSECQVLIDYVRRPSLSSDSDYVMTHAYQTLRAVARALQAQYQTAEIRTRNGVDLQRPTIAFTAEQEKLAGEEVVLAGLTITFSAFDPWVMGATISSS